MRYFSHAHELTPDDVRVDDYTINDRSEKAVRLGPITFYGNRADMAAAFVKALDGLGYGDMARVTFDSNPNTLRSNAIRFE